MVEVMRGWRPARGRSLPPRDPHARSSHRHARGRLLTVIGWGVTIILAAMSVVLVYVTLAPPAV
jgi:hypothetical protein